MPRKRRAAKLRRDEHKPLTAVMTHVLLHGWGGSEQWPEDREGWPDAFLATAEDFARLWQIHRTELLAEARRRGITPVQPWATQGFEETTE